jgi:phage-related minor tail protein
VAGKDKLEFDVLANDKASAKFDKIARASKDLGSDLNRAADKGKSALKELGKGADKAGDSLANIGDKGKKGLAALGAGLKAGPLAMIGIGVGLGAAVMEGFQTAMEAQDANALLTAQLGATDEEAEKLGGIAGDMYKNAFGDSVSEVNQVMKTVFQSGLATVRDSEAAIKGVTEQVMNYSKLTGEEALPVTRAISQMLKTGLARNATEAFDLLTRGAQKGLDKSEDLLDTVNEYGTQFRKVGLTGQQAFGLISQAIQAGARDSDIAADAIKEFSIRAVDGSELTKASFKGIGLDAAKMSATIAQGGPKAAAALGLTLDKLRAIKDPAQRAQLAVGLFGTQAEDLGDALYAMDLDTAATDFGNVAGAAKRAGDVINDTASNKLKTIGRTIKTEIADAIGKYALPKLEQFADWFNGPGKMAMVGWAIGGAQAVIGFADKTLGALDSMLGGMSKYGRVALTVAAASVAAFSPGLAKNMLDQANAIGGWAEEASTGIKNARGELKNWNSTLESAKLKVELQADIEDLEAKLAKAHKDLRNPGLTKERRAILTANIAQLTRQKDAALRKLNDPGLIKTRVAQLTANKTSLDAKLAQARRSLADPRLTATKRAKLEAYIGQLLRQKAQAQASINSLTGKTVNVTVRYSAVGLTAAIAASTRGGGKRERGGPVRKGEAYVVGEKRPELFVPEQNGKILPSVPPAASMMGGGLYSGVGGGGGASFSLSFDDSETSRFVVKMLRKGLTGGGVGNNLQLLIGGRPA